MAVGCDFHNHCGFSSEPRNKEELLPLISKAFMGRLVNDGSGACRERERQQRWLDQLIHKAIALTLLKRACTLRAEGAHLKLRARAERYSMTWMQELGLSKIPTRLEPKTMRSEY